MYNAYAWDSEIDMIVPFQSQKGCCTTCGEDIEFGFVPTYADDPCCCIHQEEYGSKRSI